MLALRPVNLIRFEDWKTETESYQNQDKEDSQV